MGGRVGRPAHNGEGRETRPQHGGQNVGGSGDPPTTCETRPQHVDVSQNRPEIVEKLRQQLQTLAQEAAPPHESGNQAPAGFRVPAIWGGGGAAQ